MAEAARALPGGDCFVNNETGGTAMKRVLLAAGLCLWTVAPALILLVGALWFIRARRQ